MSSYSRKIQWLVWGGLFLIILSILVSYITQVARKKPSTQEGTVADNSAPANGRKILSSADLPILSEVTDFRLTNQSGKAVSLADLKERVWVADIIFTRCPGPCAKLTRQMRKIQAALPPGAPVTFLSLTADPVYDTPEILREYAVTFNADTNNWWFLTGPKKDVYKLAIEGLRFAVQEKDAKEITSENDLFIHATYFIVVDQQGRVRGYFEGAEPEAPEQVINAVNLLMKEKK